MRKSHNFNVSSPPRVANICSPYENVILEVSVWFSCALRKHLAVLTLAIKHDKNLTTWRFQSTYKRFTVVPHEDWAVIASAGNEITISTIGTTDGVGL